MMSCFNSYFGIDSDVNIPAALLDDYLLLTDPFNEDVYGYIVGYSAAVPSYRSAIERIKKENNNEILTLIMASPNPEGRIYAIEAISSGNLDKIRNNKIYSNILSQLVELRISIQAAAGCIVYSMKIDSLKKIDDAMRYVQF